MKNSTEVSQKIRTKLPHDPTILLLGIYPKKTKSLMQKETHAPMLMSVC